MPNPFYDARNRVLKDRKIVATLKQAAKDYENGEIAEVKETLAEIYDAIQEFEMDQEALLG